MFDNPMMTTPFAVVQVMRDFAKKIGMEETYGEILAQIHLQQSPVLPNWGKFLMGECRLCKKTPSSCAFLNPTKRQCMENQSPAEVSSANRTAVTYGRIKKCPLFSKKEPPTESQE